MHKRSEDNKNVWRNRSRTKVTKYSAILQTLGKKSALFDIFYYYFLFLLFFFIVIFAPFK